MNTINTCKIIGKLEDRLEQRRVGFKGVTRNEVKAFVFKSYPGTAIPMIEKKIVALEKKTKKGKNYRPSFHYVDDRIVKAGMRVHWKIPIPKPGKPSLYNLKNHAWQALGALTCYLHQLELAASGTF